MKLLMPGVVPVKTARLGYIQVHLADFGNSNMCGMVIAVEVR